MRFLKIFFKAKPKIAERRRSNRVSADDEFRIDFQASASTRMYCIATGKDISLTGMRIATFAPLQKGEIIEGLLYFNKNFPGLKKMILPMQVARIYRPFGAKRYRVGMNFLQSPQYKSELEVVRQFIFWLKTQKKRNF